MCLFYFSMLCFLAFSRTVFCQVGKLNLKISSIERKVESLDFNVKLLNIETAEMKTMILDINSTCLVRNKQANIENMEISTPKYNVVSKHESGYHRQTRLMKAFKDEKAFNKKAIMDLKNAQSDLIQKARSLGNETLALYEIHNNTVKLLHNIKSENKANFEMFEKEVSEAIEGIQSLKYGLLHLRKNISETSSIQQNLERQYDTLSKKIASLEASYERIPKTFPTYCDDPWLYNKVLDKCFLFISKRRTWSDSMNFCTDKGGRLVEIQNSATHESVKNMFEETGLDWGGGHFDGFWAGGSRQGWQWRWAASNKRIEWANWYGNEPSGGSQTKLCVMTNDIKLRWDDQDHYVKHPFICEKLIN